MTTPNNSPRKTIGKKLAAVLVASTVLGVGIAGFEAATGSVAQAEAVRVETPAAAPSFADIIEKVSPAVVSVRVKTNVQPASNTQFNFNGQDLDQLPPPLQKFFRDFGPQFGPNEGFRNRSPQRQQRARPIAQGSGFFISEDGYLVTNNHVVDSGTEYTVVMDDGTELDAKLIGADPRTDLALLKVEEARKFTYVAFADDHKVRVGDWVVAVGNPFGLGGTVTAGIVSAMGRDIGAGPYDDFIQIDAAVNHGNSGGPTFNLNGEVVGINTAIFSPSGGNVGIAFAVPASVAKNVIDELMNDGSVQRGWLGVAIQPVTADIAESLGLEKTDGALVADPQKDAPAAEAGIRAGDIIVAVNGKDIKGPRELAREIANFDPGTSVDVKILRRGKEQTISVKLGELPTEQTAAASQATPDQQSETALADYGLTVAPAEDGAGVIVTEVAPDSPAADAGIRAGDKVVEVNNETVASASDIEKELKAVTDSGRKAALMLLEREDASRFVAIPTERG